MISLEDLTAETEGERAKALARAAQMQGLFDDGPSPGHGLVLICSREAAGWNVHAAQIALEHMESPRGWPGSLREDFMRLQTQQLAVLVVICAGRGFSVSLVGLEYAA